MAAKLQHPVLLCNDINLKTIISVVREDDLHILITCKDFVKRYNLIDRKQVNSWITKSWLPFTVGAVKDISSNQIYAVMCNSSFCEWPVDAVDIENVKKYSFKSRIHRLITGKKATYIVYASGFIETFNIDALKRKKQPKAQVINKDEQILECQLFEKKKLAAFLLKNQNGNLSIFKLQIGSENKQESYSLSLTNFYLTGSCISSSGKLLTTWSDGNLYSLNIFNETSSLKPGLLQGNMKQFKRTKNIKILELSPTHIAMQGMEVNEEGGLVLLWDTKFGFIVNSKPLKMYNDPPLAYNLGPGIVVGDGGSLAFIPVALEYSTVASVFGSRITENPGYSDDCCGIWAEHFSVKNENSTQNVSKKAYTTLPSKKINTLKEIFLKFQNGSMTQDIVVDLAVAYILEKKDLQLLLELLNEIDGIQESSLVAILKHLLETSNECFDSVKSLSNEKEGLKENIECFKGVNEELKEKKCSLGEKKNTTIDVRYSSMNGVSNDAKYKNVLSSPFRLTDDATTDESQKAESPFSASKANLINKVLLKPFTRSHLSNSLKKLGFTNSFALIQYLHYLLASGKAPLVKDKSDDVPCIKKACFWLSLLLDTNYHQLVLTSENEIHRKFLTFFSDIAALHSFLEASVSIDTLVKKVLHSEVMPTSQSDSPYSIERLVIS